jgi:dTDP-D-glucose 4,6-dehydratase
LKYRPTHNFQKGLKESLTWYHNNLKQWKTLKLP